MVGLRYSLPLVVLAACWLGPGAARASGDFGCATVWKLAQSTYADCNNLPFLSPGNDTRVNLQLLLIDGGKANLEPPPKADTPTAPIASSASPFTWEAFVALAGPKGPGANGGGDANSDYAQGEGSRCRSNADGANAFETALAASPAVPATERAALRSAREALAPSCDESAKPAPYTPPAGITSPLGRQFGEYLAGTADFYAGDYDAARAHFAALKAARQPWLKETARYMLGRVAVNKAQAFDAYGGVDQANVDQAALREADEDFRAYLAQYPKGLYAASAQGLIRRVDWLGNRPGKLAADYAWSFAHTDPNERNVGVSDLVMEADSKLLTKTGPTDVGDPMLTAVLDLMQMRSAPPDQETPPPVIKYDDLVAQKPVFAANPDLYEYLLAAHRFYVEHDAAAALSHLGSGPPAGPMGDLAFSRLMLRGVAIEAGEDWTGARTLWLAMIPLARPAFQRPLLDLALAQADENSGRLAEVFAPASPIVDPQVREILLRNDASPALLAQRVKDAGAAARERRVARYVLLYKDVMRGRYSPFAGDAALTAPPAPSPADPNDPLGAEPDTALFDWAGTDGDYPCPDLAKLVKLLAAAPRAPHNLICLGELARLKGLDGDALNRSAQAGELGSAPTQFPGRSFARLDAYKQILADPKAPTADRAYALYRAINCYAPAGRNECDGGDVARAERQRWFQTLKRDYAGSVWARTLKYYW